MNSFAGTVSRSTTSTMTAARVRNVMIEVYADVLNIVAAGFLAPDRGTKWNEDLRYLLEQEAVASFQIQLKSPGSSALALQYEVSADGTLRTTDNAGGIDYHSLPPNTTAFLCVELDQTKDLRGVREYLVRRDWGFNGETLSGNGTHHRTYSSEGYGVTRSRIGNWG